MKGMFIIIIILASIMEYFGDANFKHYARDGENKYLLYGIVIYLIMIFIIIKALKYSNVMYMNLNWDAISIIVETALAYLLLKETLTNEFQISGFILILAGITLLSVGKIPY